MKPEDEQTNGHDRAPAIPPVDIAWLAAFRIVFGLLAFASVVMTMAGNRWLGASLHFSYPFFEWITVPTAPAMRLLLGALAVLALGIAAGLFYRACALLFFIGNTFVFLCDASRYRDEAWLLCLLSALMIVMPAHRAASLDVRRGGVSQLDAVPAWTLWLLRFQIGIVYLFGGIARLHADWLSGLPVKFWLADAARLPFAGPVLAHPAAVWIVAWGMIGFFLLIVPLLLWRPTRAIALVMASCFHLTSALAFANPMYSLIMAACLVVFLDPSWPRRAGWLRDAANTGTQSPHPALRPPGPVTWALLALYAAAQIAIPMRHALMTGNILWTDAGSDFAWRAKVRSKATSALIHIAGDATRPSRTIELAEALPPPLAARVSSRPDLIRQYAIHLADEEQAKSGTRPRITARVLCSLNARMPRLLIDPEFNLATASPSWRAPEWIMSPTNRPVGDGSASELDSLETKNRRLRNEVAAIEILIREAKADLAKAADTDRKERLDRRLVTLNALRAEKEKRHAETLEELQDARMASASVQTAREAD